MNIFSKIKSKYQDWHMDRMQKRMTKYIQKREKRRALLQNEMYLSVDRVNQRKQLNPHQTLQYVKHEFASQLQKERMEVVRHRASRGFKVILKKSA